MLRHGIVTALAKGITSEDSPDGEKKPFYCAMLHKSLYGILRACRSKATCRGKKRRNKFTIKFYHNFPYKTILYGSWQRHFSSQIYKIEFAFSTRKYDEFLSLILLFFNIKLFIRIYIIFRLFFIRNFLHIQKLYLHPKCK